jgi:hypothetical protein
MSTLRKCQFCRQHASTFLSPYQPRPCATPSLPRPVATGGFTRHAVRVTPAPVSLRTVAGLPHAQAGPPPGGVNPTCGRLSRQERNTPPVLSCLGPQSPGLPDPPTTAAGGGAEIRLSQRPTCTALGGAPPDSCHRRCAVASWRPGRQQWLIRCCRSCLGRYAAFACLCSPSRALLLHAPPVKATVVGEGEGGSPLARLPKALPTH